MRRLSSLAALCWTFALPAVAAAAQEDEWSAPPPAWEGVWQGMIGALPVHVCLDKTPSQTKGAYYYDRVKRLLRLVQGNAEGEWFEQATYDKNGARWRVSMRGNALGGVWSHGGKSLPVRLRRIGGPSKEYEGPCGSLEFHRPRISAPRLTAKPGSMNGAKFTSWTFRPGPWLKEVEVSTFSLDRPSAGVARVNAMLRHDLPRPDGIGEWLECVAAGANASGMDGSYFKTIEPKVIGARWLGARENGDYFCGGAHPDNVNIPRTFDLVAGIEVDPLDWFGSKAVHRQEVGEGRVRKTLTSEFVAALLRGWKHEAPECDEAMRAQEYWSAGIERGALVFSPQFPRVIMACGEDFKVSFARLERWLNEKGKAEVATLPR